MLGFGLLSSVFDLAAFAILLLVFRAGEAEFQTAWFAPVALAIADGWRSMYCRIAPK